MKISAFPLPVEAESPDKNPIIKLVPPPAEKINEYADVEELKAIIHGLRGRKFLLNCGHRVTFGYFLGNDILIRNGKECEIVCRDCA